MSQRSFEACICKRPTFNNADTASLFEDIHAKSLQQDYLRSETRLISELQALKRKAKELESHKAADDDTLNSIEFFILSIARSFKASVTKTIKLLTENLTHFRGILFWGQKGNFNSTLRWLRYLVSNNKILTKKLVREPWSLRFIQSIFRDGLLSCNYLVAQESSRLIQEICVDACRNNSRRTKEVLGVWLKSPLDGTEVIICCLNTYRNLRHVLFSIIAMIFHHDYFTLFLEVLPTVVVSKQQLIELYNDLIVSKPFTERTEYHHSFLHSGLLPHIAALAIDLLETDLNGETRKYITTLPAQEQCTCGGVSQACVTLLTEIWIRYPSEIKNHRRVIESLRKAASISCNSCRDPSISLIANAALLNLLENSIHSEFDQHVSHLLKAVVYTIIEVGERIRYDPDVIFKSSKELLCKGLISIIESDYHGKLSMSLVIGPMVQQVHSAPICESDGSLELFLATLAHSSVNLRDCLLIADVISKSLLTGICMETYELKVKILCRIVASPSFGTANAISQFRLRLIRLCVVMFVRSEKKMKDIEDSSHGFLQNNLCNYKKTMAPSNYMESFQRVRNLSKSTDETLDHKDELHHQRMIQVVATCLLQILVQFQMVYDDQHILYEEIEPLLRSANYQCMDIGNNSVGNVLLAGVLETIHDTVNLRSTKEARNVAHDPKLYIDNTQDGPTITKGEHHGQLDKLNSYENDPYLSRNTSIQSHTFQRQQLANKNRLQTDENLCIQQNINNNTNTETPWHTHNHLGNVHIKPKRKNTNKFQPLPLPARHQADRQYWLKVKLREEKKQNENLDALKKFCKVARCNYDDLSNLYSNESPFSTSQYYERDVEMLIIAELAQSQQNNTKSENYHEVVKASIRAFEPFKKALRYTYTRIAKSGVSNDITFDEMKNNGKVISVSEWIKFLRDFRIIPDTIQSSQALNLVSHRLGKSQGVIGYLGFLQALKELSCYNQQNGYTPLWSWQCLCEALAGAAYTSKNCSNRFWPKQSYVVQHEKFKVARYVAGILDRIINDALDVQLLIKTEDKPEVKNPSSAKTIPKKPNKGTKAILPKKSAFSLWLTKTKKELNKSHPDIRKNIHSCDVDEVARVLWRISQDNSVEPAKASKSVVKQLNHYQTKAKQAIKAVKEDKTIKGLSEEKQSKLKKIFERERNDRKKAALEGRKNQREKQHNEELELAQKAKEKAKLERIKRRLKKAKVEDFKRKKKQEEEEKKLIKEAEDKTRKQENKTKLEERTQKLQQYFKEISDSSKQKDKVSVFGIDWNTIKESSKRIRNKTEKSEESSSMTEVKDEKFKNKVATENSPGDSKINLKKLKSKGDAYNVKGKNIDQIEKSNLKDLKLKAAVFNEKGEAKNDNVNDEVDDEIDVGSKVSETEKAEGKLEEGDGAIKTPSTTEDAHSGVGGSKIVSTDPSELEQDNSSPSNNQPNEKEDSISDVNHSLIEQNPGNNPVIEENKVSQEDGNSKADSPEKVQDMTDETKAVVAESNVAIKASGYQEDTDSSKSTIENKQILSSENRENTSPRNTNSLSKVEKGNPEHEDITTASVLTNELGQIPNEKEELNKTSEQLKTETSENSEDKKQAENPENKEDYSKSEITSENSNEKQPAESPGKNEEYSKSEITSENRNEKQQAENPEKNEEYSNAEITSDNSEGKQQGANLENNEEYSKAEITSDSSKGEQQGANLENNEEYSKAEITNENNKKNIEKQEEKNAENNAEEYSKTSENSEGKQQAENIESNDESKAGVDENKIEN